MLRKGFKITSKKNKQGYEVIELIGNPGGFGFVFKVIDLLDNTHKALKFIPQYAPYSTAEAIKFLNREAEAVINIDDVNVIKVYDYDSGEDASIGKYNFIVMELADNNLRSQINGLKNLLNPQEAMKLFNPILNGIKILHDNGVIHRDLKPENILLKGKEIKICDFGLAKHVEEVTRSKSFKGFGTIPYMAPETWENLTATFATDIYSLGIIFYELLTTKLPFIASNELEYRQQHLYGDIPNCKDINQEVSVELNGIIRKMMNKEPRSRYNNCNELIKEFSALPTIYLSVNEGFSSIINKAT